MKFFLSHKARSAVLSFFSPVYAHLSPIPLRRLSLKLSRGKVVDTNHESRRHILTCRDVCDKVCDNSATDPFVSF